MIGPVGPTAYQTHVLSFRVRRLTKPYPIIVRIARIGSPSGYSGIIAAGWRSTATKAQGVSPVPVVDQVIVTDEEVAGLSLPAPTNTIEL